MCHIYIVFGSTSTLSKWVFHGLNADLRVHYDSYLLGNTDHEKRV